MTWLNADFEAPVRQTASDRKKVLRRNSVWLVLGILVCVTFHCWYSWRLFHPADVTPVVGPAGAHYKAFIEPRGFGDIGFFLCVSDWPHTFSQPITLGSVPHSEPPYDGEAFWSMDGTVLAIRKEDNKFEAAYDYQTHQLIEYGTERIEQLMASRGGLGPKHLDYPDAKGP